MTQQAVLETVAVAARRQQRLSDRLLRETEKRAAEMARQKATKRREKVMEKLSRRRLRIRRMHVALRGVANLCALGQSPQFQSLIKAHGRPLVFYGGEYATSPGYDMSDIWWKWVSCIELTATTLRLVNHTETSGDFGNTFKVDFRDFLLELPYGDCRAYARSKPLWSIATSFAEIELYEDEEDEGSRKFDVNDVYSTERLFDAVVACGDAKKFEKLVRAAIER